MAIDIGHTTKSATTTRIKCEICGDKIIRGQIINGKITCVRCRKGTHGHEKVTSK